MGDVYLKNLIHSETWLLARDATPGSGVTVASAQLGCDAQLIKRSPELLAHNAEYTTPGKQHHRAKITLSASAPVFLSSPCTHSAP